MFLRQKDPGSLKFEGGLIPPIPLLAEALVTELNATIFSSSNFKGVLLQDIKSRACQETGAIAPAPINARRSVGHGQ
jgi:hypothetical protein